MLFQRLADLRAVLVQCRRRRHNQIGLAIEIERVSNRSKQSHLGMRRRHLDLEMLREVYDFLELDGFDADALKALMEDRSQSVRHSHVAGQDLDGGETDYRRKLALEHNPDATPAELDRIERLCAPLAARFGYGASSAVRPAGRVQV